MLERGRSQTRQGPAPDCDECRFDLRLRGIMDSWTHVSSRERKPEHGSSNTSRQHANTTGWRERASAWAGKVISSGAGRMHGEYKIPGGKLVVADLNVVDARLTDVRVSGDFFIEPDSALDAIDAATDSAVDAGFLLPKDAELIKARARTSPLPTSHPD